MGPGPARRARTGSRAARYRPERLRVKAAAGQSGRGPERMRSERRGGAARLVLGRQGRGEPRAGALKPLQADGGEVLAPFPELQGFLQGEPPVFQPLDHRHELVARLLVGHLFGGCRHGRLATGGLVHGGLAHGGLAPGGLAMGRAAAAFRLTRLGGHGANLAGYWPVMLGRPLRAGLHGTIGTAAAAGPVAWTADATTFA
jgi:hypothetical protein